MQVLVVAVVAMGMAGITFFSGFGLGTVLLPVFALFYPPEVAVAATAVVHLLNNALKFGLLWRAADRGVVLAFGLPAIAAAFAGAVALDRLAAREPLTTYSIGARTFAIDVLDVVIAALLIVVGLQELIPRLGRIAFGRRALPFGGIVSGFLGGLAGLQGAVRSVFLIRLGLSAPAFIATGVAVGLLVDITRVGVYGTAGALTGPGTGLGLVAAGVAGASVGTIAASRVLTKATIGWIRVLVGAMLIAIALALGAGLV